MSNRVTQPLLPLRLDLSRSGKLTWNAPAQVEDLAASYALASPFPHVVIDDLLPSDLAAELVQRFPSPDRASRRFDDVGGSFRKRQFLPQDIDDSVYRDLFFVLNGGEMLSALESLTGIDGLLPDPYYDGGGLHEIEPGGSLGVHTDFRVNKRLMLERRINLLLYLNPDWQSDWGGNLELWRSNADVPDVTVEPRFNRCVIFSTSATSLHGHPAPLRCPAGISRRSLALYYYTASRSVEYEVPTHSTIYRTTDGNRRANTKLAAQRALRDWTPPALYRWARAVGGRPR